MPDLPNWPNACGRRLNERYRYHFPSRSPNDLADDFPQHQRIPLRQPPKHLHNESLFERSDDRLDRRGLQEPGHLPVMDDDFTEGPAAADLAGDGHEDHITPLAVIGTAGDNDARAPL